MNVVAVLRFTLLIWLGSLFGLLGVERFLFSPLDSLPATLGVFVFQTLPILAAAPVTLRSPARGAFWSSLASMLYFVHGVATLVTPSDRLFGMLEIGFALAAFVTSIMLLRATGNSNRRPG